MSSRCAMCTAMQIDLGNVKGKREVIEYTPEVFTSAERIMDARSHGGNG